MTGKKVLIVENEPIIALDFEYIIKDLGFESLGKISEGKKALTIISKNKPDIVLLDINLNHNVSGYEIAEVLLEKKIPFIVITGSADEVSLKRISDLKADGVLIKPVYRSELEKTINEIVS